MSVCVFSKLDIFTWFSFSFVNRSATSNSDLIREECKSFTVIPPACNLSSSIRLEILRAQKKTPKSKNITISPKKYTARLERKKCVVWETLPDLDSSLTLSWPMDVEAGADSTSLSAVLSPLGSLSTQRDVSRATEFFSSAAFSAAERSACKVARRSSSILHETFRVARRFSSVLFSDSKVNRSSLNFLSDSAAAASSDSTRAFSDFCAASKA
mmetsp:Transcript_37335/g.54962  ORF Transcript_37335/g.54962 Transcript_37335/m.54962 type:complete len:213 (+) Transcript_37335:1122-1760(+)